METAKNPERKPRGSLRAFVYTSMHGLGLAWLFFCAVYVAPQFEAMFKEMGDMLPPMTQTALQASSFVRVYWFALAPLAALVIVLDFKILAWLCGRGRLRAAEYWAVCVLFMEGVVFLGLLIALLLPVVGNLYQVVPR